MTPIIFFRSSSTQFEEEEKIAREVFGYNLVNKRHELSFKFVNPNVVFGRYSVLPFYKELEEEVNHFGHRLINSFEQHKYIASFKYYEDLKDYTFKTYNDSNFYTAPEGAYVVKGCTNSKKLAWNKKMFAPDKKTALNIAGEIMDDGALLGQHIIYRKFEKLVTYDTGLNGLPITNEWRFFFIKDKMIVNGYYWSEFHDEYSGNLNQEGLDFANKIAEIVSKKVNFFVVDIAQKEDGSWILVELNDGQQSGPSGCDLRQLYTEISRFVD